MTLHTKAETLPKLPDIPQPKPKRRSRKKRGLVEEIEEKKEETVKKPAKKEPEQEQLSKEQLLKIYKACRKDVHIFARMFCKDVVSSKVPDFHKEICSLIKDNDRVALAAPRGFAKSTIISKIFPLYLALFQKRADICIISASESLAVEHVRYIKQKLESDPFILRYWGDLKSTKWTEKHLILYFSGNRQIVNIRAKGAGGQIRGFRPDCIILDDIETDESVESEEQRKKLKNWLFKACLNTLLPGGQMLLIGTLIHPLSVLADLLDMDNDWVKRKYTAYVDGIEADGHELWPDERPHSWLQQRKAEIGSWAFAAEFMNDPRSDEEVPITPEMIRYWKELPDQLGCVIAVDPAYSEDAKSDFKVAALVGMDQQHNRYLIEYIRTHQKTGDFINRVLAMWYRHKDKVTALGVPCQGPEKQFFQTFQKQASERASFPPLTELKNSFTSTTGGTVRNKKHRIIASLQPFFEQGKYYIGQDHIEARDELLTIGSSRWDDLVDTMAYAEQLLTPIFFDIEKYEDEERPWELAGSAEGYGIEY